jgi:hypothetical protein
MGYVMWLSEHLIQISMCELHLTGIETRTHGLPNNPPRTQKLLFYGNTSEVRSIQNEYLCNSSIYYRYLFVLAGFGSGVETRPAIWRGLGLHTIDPLSHTCHLSDLVAFVSAVTSPQSRILVRVTLRSGCHKVPNNGPPLQPANT